MRPVHRRRNRKMTISARAIASAATAAALCLPAHAYESDVHHGLTRWLALQAGYTASQADAIAIADQRVDGGRLETLELSLEYACAGHFPDAARRAQQAHYPAARPVPAPAAERAVVPGGDAAHRRLEELAPRLAGKAGVFLGKLGEALHPLQYSWAHRGVASQPRPGSLPACDAALASAHPAALGGPGDHAADLTARRPADTLDMARATYEALVRYPPVEGRPRAPADWARLAPLVDAFAKASTKTQKRIWFVGQGMADTSFLSGTSLPDGPDPGALVTRRNGLLPLPGEPSMQHDAPVDVRAFFDRLLARWLGAEEAAAIAADMGPGGTGTSRGAAASAASRELAARLRLWRLRDHGSAAELAHAPAPLAPAQLRLADRLTRDERALLPPMAVSAAVLPLQPAGPEAMPLLPYIVRALPAVAGRQRMVAIARLGHAPYDTVGWIAERQDDRWVLVEMVSAVDP